MGSDRARVSYNQNQQYHGVIAQQGRVTLEADWNESQQILNEEIRQQVNDFVGPCGTPDNGYEIKASNSPFDFTVGAGSMYVGGIRAFLPVPPKDSEPLKYSQQQDWLDSEGDPDWIDIKNINSNSQELIYLYLREQEISAVEDSALREVALGGPDTTQRLRLIQHIVRQQVDADTCVEALEQAIKKWKAQGLQFNSTTMQLVSQSTLQASFSNPTKNTDPCIPEARAGYLGADNQLIRVQISSVDPIHKKYKLIWGFDNASFLYQVDNVVETTINQTLRLQLQLQSRPVDEFHQPRSGQVVEVLRSAAQLSNGEYVASANGLVTTVYTPYNPSTKDKEITLSAPLSPENQYFTSTKLPLFARIWEQEEDFSPGTAVVLGDTGLQVTLHTENNQPFHIGDYWQIAVRPNTLNPIYPQRYFDAPQPPDGPRLWVCPLALIGWKRDRDKNKNTLEVISDCRSQFDNLVELTQRKTGNSCCTITIKPEDIKPGKTLQSIIDNGFLYNTSVTICLMPGEYRLTEPLRIEEKHSHLTLKGCHDGVILKAADETNINFVNGLIILTNADNITICRLEFELPLVLLPRDTILVKSFGLENTSTSIAIRLISCTTLTIQDCIFHFFPVKSSIFGSAIFAGGQCQGLKIQHNQFLKDIPTVFPLPTPKVQHQIETSSRIVGSEEITSNLTAISPNATTERPPLQILFGYLQLPHATPTIKEREPVITKAQVLPSLLQNAVFRDNSFTRLTFATLVISDFGTVIFADNTVRECHAGFWLESLCFWNVILDEKTKIDLPITLSIAKEIVDSIMSDPLVLSAMKIALFYPLPEKSEVRKQELVFPEINISSQKFSWKEIQKLFTAVHRSDLSLPFIAHCSNNIIDTSTASINQISNIGLLLLSDSLTERVRANEHSEMIVSANKICNRAIAKPILDKKPEEILPEEILGAPTVLILGPQRCTITGNLIVNEAYSLQNQQRSLSLVFHTSSTQIAITGNVLQGQSTLGLILRRGFNSQISPPMNSWLFLNTEIL